MEKEDIKISELEELIDRFNSNAEFEKTNGDLQGYLEFKKFADYLSVLKDLLT